MSELDVVSLDHPSSVRAGPNGLLLRLGLALILAACSTPAATVTPMPDPSASDGATSSPAAPGSTSPTASPSPSPGSSSATDWRLVWGDEFDEPAGTPPDPAHWGYALGDGTAESIAGWGNRELEWYTDDPANAATDGLGNLVITAREGDGSRDCYYGPCKYTSARLLTSGRFEVEFGKVEARIKVPSGVGLWPAFWMLGTNIGQVGWPDSGEIDVMENVGRQPNRLYGTIHGPGYSGDRGFSKTIDLPDPVADDFHVFAVEWSAGRIRWFLDGEQFHEATPADVAPNAWAFDHPFYLLLNLAVGGNFGGAVSPDTVFPAAMLVDYVRVYEAA